MPVRTQFRVRTGIPISWVYKMIVKINGKEEKIENGLNLQALVINKNLSPDRIVIEHNLNIVPKGRWQSIILQENDNIEIVSFVSGG